MNQSSNPRILFTFWGRRGAMTQFALEIAEIAMNAPERNLLVSVSRQNESFQSFKSFKKILIPIDTFSKSTGVLLQSYRIIKIKRKLKQIILKKNVDIVVELMPHVWSSFIMKSIKNLDCRYFTVIHDVESRRGDWTNTGIVKNLLDKTTLVADKIFTLSQNVADILIKQEKVTKNHVITLFHPYLRYSRLTPKSPRSANESWRLLFLGRIMPYKGLSVFIKTAKILQCRGIPIQIGVYGEGSIDEYIEDLSLIGADVKNYWLSSEEIAAALLEYHIVVLSHQEASQSGVAAAALGMGIPIAATPVGGLVEQVRDGENGVLASDATPIGLADALSRLMDEDRYIEITKNILSNEEKMSMKKFVGDIIRSAHL